MVAVCQAAPELTPMSMMASVMLWEAVDCGDMASVRRLLSFPHLSLNFTPAFSDYTPLMVASFRGHVHIARMLLKAHVSPDTRSAHAGWTALHYACAQRHASLVALLLDAGADATLVNRDGMTASDLCTGWVPGQMLLQRHCTPSPSGFNRHRRPSYGSAGSTHAATTIASTSTGGNSDSSESTVSCDVTDVTRTHGSTTVLTPPTATADVKFAATQRHGLTVRLRLKLAGLVRQAFACGPR